MWPYLFQHQIHIFQVSFDVNIIDYVITDPITQFTGLIPSLHTGQYFPAGFILIKVTTEVLNGLVGFH